MKQDLLKVAAAFAMLVAFVATPALAIDVQAGGRANAFATIGEAVTDENDQELDRCECEGGPLDEIEAHTRSGGWTAVARDDFSDASVKTTDGTVIGTVIGMGNMSGDNAIVIYVRVEGGVLGDIERLNIRRTGFYWADGVVIDTTLADLESSLAGI